MGGWGEVFAAPVKIAVLWVVADSNPATQPRINDPDEGIIR
jgi:hypothetical protein